MVIGSEELVEAQLRRIQTCADMLFNSEEVTILRDKLKFLPQVSQIPKRFYSRREIGNILKELGIDPGTFLSNRISLIVDFPT